MSTVPIQQTDDQIEIEALRASEARFRTYFEMGVVGIAVTSPEKGLFQFNDKLCEILGYSREELAARSWAELTHPGDLDKDAAQFARVLAGEIDGYELNKRFIRKNGEIVHVHVSGKCLRQPVGKAPILVAIVQDITARKLAEEALLKSQERFELAVRGSSDGIWDWDIQTGAAYHSPRFRELLGYEPSEFGDTREAFDSHLHPEDRQRTWAAVQSHLEKREPYDTEYRLRTRAGAYRWFRARGQAVWHSDGQAVRMAGSITDIHDHRIAEESLRQAQAQMLATKEAFTRRLIAAQDEERKWLADELHDSLGQSLSLMKNRAYFALEQPGLPPAAASHVQAIAEIVTSALAELRNLTQNLRPLQVEQLGLTDSLQGMAERVAESSRIQLAWRFEPVDDLFKGEQATMVYRIIQEALNNVIKHSQASSAHVVVERDLHCVRIRVEDNGRGFESPPPGAPRSATGGIGLTSMNERARILGGTLTIQSTPGKGTFLRVEVPIPEAAAC